MLCEHSNWQQYVPFFACNICEHLRILCERGLGQVNSTGWQIHFQTEQDLSVPRPCGAGGNGGELHNANGEMTTMRRGHSECVFAVVAEANNQRGTK